MRLFKLSILFLVIVVSNVQCQPLKKSDSVLQSQVREPKIKSEKPPLLILLHGYGSNEQDLFALAQYLPENFLIISARAPVTLGEGSYAWYHADFSTPKPIYNKEEAEKSRKTIIQFIEELKQKHSFDEKRIYLCGFSQGGIMTYSVGLTRPDLIKGIAVMSGRLLEDVKPLIVKNEKLKQLNIFISHGTNDPVLNIQNARDAVNYLKTSGLNPSYKEYNEGHTISNEMLNDLVSWLKR